ncbi:MAG: SusD/RagB family nutrient-binding outer membrane lipoprotein [Gemmatimonadaceae bacterium]
MRSYKLASFVAATALSLSVVACNNDKLTSINTDPNNPTDAPAGALFTNATVTSVQRWLGGGYNLRVAQFLVQFQTEDQYSDEDRYVRFDATSTAGFMTTAYSSELADLNRVIQKGIASAAPGIYGPARVVTAWDFSFITNTFGDVPYSEALQGDSAKFSPKYDAQQDIFTDLFAKLTAASTAMNAEPTNAPLGSNDPIYGGVESKWVKFANSLRARLAIQIINVAPAKAGTELTAALSAPGGVFTSNADNAKITWPGDGIFNNGWSDFFKTRDDNRMSAQFLNLLIGLNDPRITVFAQPATKTLVGCKTGTPAGCTAPAAAFVPLQGTFGGNSYFGEPNGLTTADATSWNSASRIGAMFFPGATAYGTFGGQGAKAPSYIMTYAEIAFIKAEAANRGLAGLTAGMAAGFYNDGITASLNQWGVTDGATIAAYLAGPGVAYTPGTAGLLRIAQQKYIALFGDAGTAWTEWRRTCVPVTVKAGPAAQINTVPRRLMYASNEFSVNAASVNAAIAAQGPDLFQTRTWFDKAPTVAPTYTAGCNAP